MLCWREQIPKKIPLEETEAAQAVGSQEREAAALVLQAEITNSLTENIFGAASDQAKVTLQQGGNSSGLTAVTLSPKYTMPSNNKAKNTEGSG